MKIFIKRMFMVMILLWFMTHTASAQLPTPGTIEVRKVAQFDHRFHNDSRRENIDNVAQIRAGWVLKKAELIVEDKRGDSGISLEEFQANGKVFSESFLQAKRQETHDFFGKLTQELSSQGKDVKQLLELRARMDEDCNQLLQTRNQFVTSHSAVRVKGWTSCIWKFNFAGIRVYTSGASLKGHVLLTEMYVGDDEFVKWHLEQWKDKAKRIAGL